MKLAIIGSRHFEDYEFMKECFEGFVSEQSIAPTMLVSGGAKGADTLAKRLADEMRLPFHEICADWAKHGRGAGPIRNKQLEEFSDAVLAFPLGESKGTRGCVKLFRAAGKLVHVCERDDSSPCEPTDSFLSPAHRARNKVMAGMAERKFGLRKISVEEATAQVLRLKQQSTRLKSAQLDKPHEG